MAELTPEEVEDAELQAVIDAMHLPSTTLGTTLPRFWRQAEEFVGEHAGRVVEGARTAGGLVGEWAEGVAEDPGGYLLERTAPGYAMSVAERLEAGESPIAASGAHEALIGASVASASIAPDVGAATLYLLEGDTESAKNALMWAVGGFGAGALAAHLYKMRQIAKAKAIANGASPAEADRVADELVEIASKRWKADPNVSGGYHVQPGDVPVGGRPPARGSTIDPVTGTDFAGPAWGPGSSRSELSKLVSRADLTPGQRDAAVRRLWELTDEEAELALKKTKYISKHVDPSGKLRIYEDPYEFEHMAQYPAKSPRAGKSYREAAEAREEAFQRAIREDPALSSKELERTLRGEEPLRRMGPVSRARAEALDILKDTPAGELVGGTRIRASTVAGFEDELVVFDRLSDGTPLNYIHPDVPGKLLSPGRGSAWRLNTRGYAADGRRLRAPQGPGTSLKAPSDEAMADVLRSQSGGRASSAAYDWTQEAPIEEVRRFVDNLDEVSGMQDSAAKARVLIRELAVTNPRDAEYALRQLATEFEGDSPIFDIIPFLEKKLGRPRDYWRSPEVAAAAKRFKKK